MLSDGILESAVSLTDWSSAEASLITPYLISGIGLTATVSPSSERVQPAAGKYESLKYAARYFLRDCPVRPA